MAPRNHLMLPFGREGFQSQSDVNNYPSSLAVINSSRNQTFSHHQQRGLPAPSGLSPAIAPTEQTRSSLYEQDESATSRQIKESPSMSSSELAKTQLENVMNRAFGSGRDSTPLLPPPVLSPLAGSRRHRDIPRRQGHDDEIESKPPMSPLSSNPSVSPLRLRTPKDRMRRLNRESHKISLSSIDSFFDRRKTKDKSPYQTPKNDSNLEKPAYNGQSGITDMLDETVTHAPSNIDTHSVISAATQETYPWSSHVESGLPPTATEYDDDGVLDAASPRRLGYPEYSRSTADLNDDPFQGSYRQRYYDALRSPYGETYHRSQYRGRRASRDSSIACSTCPSDSTVMTNASRTTDGTNDDHCEKPVSAQRFRGPAPQGPQHRRGARAAQISKKQVHLINGELILECKVPTTLYQFIPRRNDREFTHMRYTAVTTDPDDFARRGYKLRQQIRSPPRETELLVCITMYNEDVANITTTIHAVMRNIKFLCSRSKSRMWGKNGWQNIVVCIIVDGRKTVSPRVLDALAAIGVYQEGIAKNVVNSKQVTAHLYEYTTQVSLDVNLDFQGADTGLPPCQIILCLKEQNTKKLNSHRWFFNAIGHALQPNVCVLLDVGTKPRPSALYHLWKAFDQDSNVAGAAGEIKAAKGRRYKGLLNPLIASQNFEYKMSNILDKPIESVFGYISVLPGALSAYRYIALQDDPETGHGPLSQYFKGETLHGKNTDVFTANMYLAEDRILCWELVAKKGEQWVLKYVKSAVGETDVPDAIPEFISQRRRWLNGAFFAAVYSLVHFRQIWKTDHSTSRKVLLHVEFLYQFLQLVFTFFSLANFYLTFYFVAGTLSQERNDPFGHHIGQYFFVTLRYACVIVICLLFILSMGNRPQGAKRMFLFCIITCSVIMLYTTFAAIYMVVIQFTQHSVKVELGENVFTNVTVSLLSTVGLYLFTSLLYLDPWHMITSSTQYFLLLPSYLCALQIFAFCNLHDISWGTKGDNIANTDLGIAARKLGRKNAEDGEVDDGVVELDMPADQRDIDTCYAGALCNLRDGRPVVPAPVSEAQQHEDYYRAVRTYMVSVWVVCNSLLAMGVTESYGPSQLIGNNMYMAVLLWSVAGLAAFRATGSVTFLLLRLMHGLADGSMKLGANSSALNGSSTAPSDGYRDHQVEKKGAARTRGPSTLPTISTAPEGYGSDISTSRIGLTTRIKDILTESGWAAHRGFDGLKRFWRK